MQITYITLFPEMFDALHYGIPGQALQKKQLEFSCLNPRDYTIDAHRTVDDRPYGGGPGMVMLFEPLFKAVHAAKATMPTAPVIYLSPDGKPLTQKIMSSLAKQPTFIMLAGRYEGVDERLIETVVDESYSVGDYIVSGGELPAMLLTDALLRLVPGVLGHPDSSAQDSFSEGLLDYPHYTRPEMIDQKMVPKVLLSGNHKAITQFRRQQSLGRTWQRRPDLIQRYPLTKADQALLDAFIRDNDREEE